MKSKNIYAIPFEKSVKFIPMSDPKVHFDNFKYAIDFIIDFNVPILAPLDGIIWNVKDDSNKGGNDKKFSDFKYQNFITIKHDKEEFSQFAHLAQNSARIKKGDLIAKGIGIVGFTTTPHVHMMVFKMLNNNDFESLEIQFEKRIKIARTEEELQKSLNNPEFEKLKQVHDTYQT